MLWTVKGKDLPEARRILFSFNKHEKYLVAF
jgi:hypothetical protein